MKKSAHRQNWLKQHLICLVNSMFTSRLRQWIACPEQYLLKASLLKGRARLYQNMHYDKRSLVNFMSLSDKILENTNLNEIFSKKNYYFYCINTEQKIIILNEVLISLATDNMLDISLNKRTSSYRYRKWLKEWRYV